MVRGVGDPRPPLTGPVTPNRDELLDFGKGKMGLFPLPLSFIFSQGNFVHQPGPHLPF